MAGGEAYKEFDNASIVTTSTTKDSTVSIGRYSFRKRDLLLGGIAIVALLAVIILVIVLAAQSQKSSSSCKDSVVSPVTGPTYCESNYCLQASVYQKLIMDTTVDPCQDFYSFACGKYPEHHPQTQFLTEVTPENEINFENDRELNYLLSDAIRNRHEHSYERKLKDFMKSCNNHFDKMDLRGTPLINKVITPLGGWYVFDTYNNDTFDFNALLKKIHVDFWTDAFFTLSVATNQNNWNNKVVQLSFGGLGLDYRLYANNPLFGSIHTTYKSYIKLNALLLSVDANISPPNDDRIDTFVDDAFEIESSISQILYGASIRRNSHSNLFTLRELNTHMKNTIDFVDYMQYLFNQWPRRFQANTPVALTVTQYFDRIGELIQNHTQTEGGKRKLHNYLMWQVINRYSHDLSWDYVHSKRKLNHLLYNFKDSSSGYSYCLRVAEASFSKAMNALFVKQHVKKEGRDAAYQMLERIKTVMVDGIKGLSWMSDHDRAEATTKIHESLYKIGYPDELVDENYIDNYYYPLDIADDDYFGNILSVNDLYQKQMNDLVGKPDSKSEWTYHVFDPIIEYFNPWSELIVTSAMIQNPLFHTKGPSYYNYGGIGSRMAANLVHAIDEYGSAYKLDGSNLGSWWSNSTRTHYSKIKECAIKYQRDEPLGPYDDGRGNRIRGNTTVLGPYWAPEVLSETSGVRMALRAFQELESAVGVEKLPPGFDKFDTRKMFFISYAQSYCRNAPDFVTIANLRTATMPNKNRVNLALQNSPEFMSTFECPQPNSSKDKQCLLFGA